MASFEPVVRKRYTASGTFRVPMGLKSLKAGGSGGGGGGSSGLDDVGSGRAGGSGGGGSAYPPVTLDVSAYQGLVLDIVIGIGGQGAAPTLGNAGADGGETSISYNGTKLLSFKGGIGGLCLESGGSAARQALTKRGLGGNGGFGGAGAGGGGSDGAPGTDSSMNGIYTGGIATAANGTAGGGGGGGAGYEGSGGAAGIPGPGPANIGHDGTGYGAGGGGGGGGGTSNGAAGEGGDGIQGVLDIEYVQPAV